MSAEKPQTEDLTSQVDALLEDIERPGADAPVIDPAVTETEQPGELLSDVQQALDAADSVEPPAEAPPETIDQLDEQLAESAPPDDDPSLSKTHADAAAEATTTPTAPTSPNAAETLRADLNESLARAAEADRAEVTDADSETEHPAPSPPASAPKPRAPVAEPSPPAQAAEPSETDQHNEEPAPAEALAAHSGAPRGGFAVAIPAAIAWPMTLLPVGVRDQVGWLALVTLFNAAVLWVFLLLRG